jgi:secondary thiamine-phosphate synthase enzyme
MGPCFLEIGRKQGTPKDLGTAGQEQGEHGHQDRRGKSSLEQTYCGAEKAIGPAEEQVAGELRGEEPEEGDTQPGGEENKGIAESNGMGQGRKARPQDVRQSGVVMAGRDKAGENAQCRRDFEDKAPHESADEGEGQNADHDVIQEVHRGSDTSASTVAVSGESSAVRFSSAHYARIPYQIRRGSSRRMACRDRDPYLQGAIVYVRNQAVPGGGSGAPARTGITGTGDDVVRSPQGGRSGDMVALRGRSTMTVVTKTAEVRTTGLTDILDITGLATEHLAESGIRHGAMILFVPGSTGALTTIEYESGVLEDLAEAIERLAPRDIEYAHDQRWGDGNGYAHVRAALVGPSLQIPVVNGRLCLGTWQQVVLLDFDNHPRMRRLIIQVIGEEE